MDYFTTNNLFCIQQFGFRPSHTRQIQANIAQDVNKMVINVKGAKLSEWLGANKSALNNYSKTNYMVFHTSKRAVKYSNLKINNTYIEHDCL